MSIDSARSVESEIEKELLTRLRADGVEGALHRELAIALEESAAGHLRALDDSGVLCAQADRLLGRAPRTPPASWADHRQTVRTAAVARGVARYLRRCFTEDFVPVRSLRADCNELVMNHFVEQYEEFCSDGAP